MRGARGAAARRAGKNVKTDAKGKKKKLLSNFSAVEDKNEGLTLRAEPLDCLGRGETLRNRSRRFWRNVVVMYEQVRSAREAMHSSFFFVYLVIFTLAVLKAMEGESLFDHHNSLAEVLTRREWYYDATHIKKDMYNVYTVPDLYLWLGGPFVNEVLPTKDSAPWDAWQGYNASRPGNFHTNLWLLSPITLRQLRVRSDSCLVSSKPVISTKRTKFDYVLPEAYVNLHNLYSPMLALDAYVSQCREVNFKPPPPGCGHNQSKPGDWGQVSRIYSLFAVCVQCLLLHTSRQRLHQKAQFESMRR